jgi:hypothetical protein
MSLADDLREGIETVVAGLMGGQQCLLNGWVLTANYVTEDGEQATSVTVAQDQPLPASNQMVSYAATWFDVLQRERFMGALEDQRDDDEEDPDVQGF